LLTNNFIFQDAPDWVNLINWRDKKIPPNKNGYCIIVDDTQLFYFDTEKQHYLHRVQTATSTGGLEEIGNLEIVFNPQNQKLIIHSVKVWENDKIKWEAKKEDFEVYRRERDVEMRVFNGNYSANLIIPNLSIGDFLETSYSIIYDDKIVDNFLDSFFRLNWSMPYGYSYYRVIIDKSRKVKQIISGDMIAPKIIDNENTKEFIIEVFDGEADKYEDNLPAGFETSPYFWLVDDVDWVYINNIFRPYYHKSDDDIAEISKTVDILKIWGSKDKREITINALKWVQENIRYLAVSVGEGGFKPRNLKNILENKYGDCKDKSLLLCYILRSFGIDANPALVSTNGYDTIHIDPARAYAFNHCIVRVKIDDEIAYFDPTYNVQAGVWGNIFSPNFYYALPLAEGFGLEKMPDEKIININNAEEEWFLPEKFEGVAKLKIKTLKQSFGAFSLRNRLAHDSIKAITADFESFMDKKYRGAKIIGDVEFIDHNDNDILEIHETYEIPYPYEEYSDKAKMNFVWKPELSLPDFNTEYTSNRKFPFSIGDPRQIIVKARFHFPREMFADFLTENISSKKWHFRVQWTRVSHKTLEIEQIFNCQGGILQAEDAKDFFKNIEIANNNAGFSHAFFRKNNIFTKILAHGPVRLIFWAIWLLYLIVMFVKK
jgi:transglutaminase-like putative cysteine protease